MKKQWEDRPNTGTLFLNDKKQSEKGPDFTGSLTVGEELAELIRKSPGLTKFRLAGWKRTSSNGSTYLSIVASTIQPPNQGTKKRTENNDDTPW
jgi:uncharacterized protein (DUF736 family)